MDGTNTRFEGTGRKTATIVGALYIIGTLAGVMSVAFTSATLSAPDYLGQIPSSANQIILGALSVLVMGFALAMVPVYLFPIFKKQNEALALGYVVLRGGVETVTYIITAISFLLLLPVSRGYVQGGPEAAANFKALGAVLQGVTHLPVTGFVFSLGALIVYYLLYRSKLIPRWISVWGFIAIALHLATCVLIVFGLQSDSSGVNTLMNMPIFFQEMVMAVWLIAKGFTPSALAALDAKEQG
jgi:hypothetical protein